MDPNTYAVAHTSIVGTPRWLGVERGTYALPLAGGASLEIDLTDAVMMRQVGRMLARVVDENRASLEAVACCAEPTRLEALAFEALSVARSVHYADGSYRVTLRGGRTVSTYVTEWDGSLLRRYDALLERVAGALMSEVA